MASPRTARATTLDVSTLVDTMFEAVLTPDERAELLVWIRRWENENPDVDNAHRITGGIDVAYAFQENRIGRTAPDHGWQWSRTGSPVFA
jgi:hypothetical protein